MIANPRLFFVLRLIKVLVKILQDAIDAIVFVAFLHTAFGIEANYLLEAIMTVNIR